MILVIDFKQFLSIEDQYIAPNKFCRAFFKSLNWWIPTFLRVSEIPSFDLRSQSGWHLYVEFSGSFAFWKVFSYFSTIVYAICKLRKTCLNFKWKYFWLLIVISRRSYKQDLWINRILSVKIQPVLKYIRFDVSGNTQMYWRFNSNIYWSLKKGNLVDCLFPMKPLTINQLQSCAPASLLLLLF